jgi:hypothetical protein
LRHVIGMLIYSYYQFLSLQAWRELTTLRGEGDAYCGRGEKVHGEWRPSSSN